MRNIISKSDYSMSRFATEDEVFTPEFSLLNSELLGLQGKYNLQDQSDLNSDRFSWSKKVISKPAYYASRMWEYPFAIIAADLDNGMKVADVGCGNTPFTAYLAKKLHPDNVFGFDPDVLEGDDGGHSHFSAKLSFIHDIGIKFFRDDIASLSTKSDFFDVVFCISVLEHIDNMLQKVNGIKELVRIVKPGGKLILTFDLGVDLPLNHIWDIISVSGLVPIGLDVSWPKKRFVNYGRGSSVDVFGLVLHKPDGLIFRDYYEEKVISAHSANHKMQEKTIFYSRSYEQILATHDLDSPMGGLRVMLKSLLGRY